MNITEPTNLHAITLLQCVNLILQTYNPTEHLISATGFPGKIDFPIIRVDYEKEISSNFFPLQSDFYLIYDHDQEKLKNQMKVLGNVTNASFNPRAKFLFISKNFTGEFAGYLSTFYIVNAIFLNVDTGEIYTYFPYTQRSLNVVNTTLESLGNCKGFLRTPLFPPKIPNTWENSTLLITFRHFDAYSMCVTCPEKGIDIDLFNIILKRTKIKGEYSMTPNVTDLDFCRNYQIFIGNYGPKYAGTPYGEFSMSYTDDAIVWIIPAPRLIPRWRYFLEIFEVNVWIACFSTVCVMSVAWGSARWIVQGLSIKEFTTVPVSTLQIFLGQAFGFHTTLTSHWILVSLILFLSILMNFFFATRLTYLLNGRNMEANLKTLDDVIDHKMFIGCPSSMLPTFNNTKKRAEHLKNYFRTCDYTPKCLTRAATVRDMAVCRTIRRTRYLRSLVDAETGKWLVKELRPPIYVKQVAAFFRKGLPVFGLFNRHIFNMVESGILKVIIERYERRTMVEDFSTPVRKLQLDHLVAPLFLWFFGVLLAILVFSIEKAIFR